MRESWIPDISGLTDAIGVGMRECGDGVVERWSGGGYQPRSGAVSVAVRFSVRKSGSAIAPRRVATVEIPVRPSIRASLAHAGGGGCVTHGIVRGGITLDLLSTVAMPRDALEGEVIPTLKT